jgi:hypothetical protein
LGRSDPGAVAAVEAAIEFYQDWATRYVHDFGVNGSVLKSHCAQYLFCVFDNGQELWQELWLVIERQE